MPLWLKRKTTTQATSVKVSVQHIVLPTHMSHKLEDPLCGHYRCAMGRGGHRGRRPHKSPASIARSKLRPGKRERQALQHDTTTDVGTGPHPSTAATPSPTTTDVPSHTYVAPASRPALTTAPKAKAAPMYIRSIGEHLPIAAPRPSLPGAVC